MRQQGRDEQGALFSACAGVGLPYRASLIGARDWFGSATRQAGGTDLTLLDDAGGIWPRSLRSISWSVPPIPNRSVSSAGPPPRSSSRAPLGSDCGVQGSKRGASNRRLRAARSYVQPAKLLVEPCQATCNHWLDLHGMQEARGSSPLSSTSRCFARSGACQMAGLISLPGHNHLGVVDLLL